MPAGKSLSPTRFYRRPLLFELLFQIVGRHGTPSAERTLISRASKVAWRSKDESAGQVRRQAMFFGCRHEESHKPTRRLTKITFSRFRSSKEGAAGRDFRGALSLPREMLSPTAVAV
jgi:hypothetical protein